MGKILVMKRKPLKACDNGKHLIPNHPDSICWACIKENDRRTTRKPKGDFSRPYPVKENERLKRSSIADSHLRAF